MKEIIKVSDISYKVKSKTIVDKVSFSVFDTDIFALLGENGSGKSTLIDLMLNDLKPSSGFVNFFGKQKNNFSNVGIVYDHLPLFPLLKVYEVIRYFSSIHKLNYNSVKIKYFEIFEIDKIANNFIKELSQGERKRVSLLLSVINNPSLLILDEPFANLDPTIIDRIWEVLKQNNRTIFLTTHNWKGIEKIATSVGFIFNGKLITETKSPKAMIENLPSDKKIIVNNTIKMNGNLKKLNYYIHDNSLHIFFDEDKDVVKIINELTSNFTMQDVDLKDAYLYYTVSNKKTML
ncbi:MAG: ABC transporter ATP-binding protein [Bacteroidales bacterium]